MFLLQQRVYLMLRHHPHRPVGLPAALDNDKGRDAHNAEGLREFGLLVYVDLHHLDMGGFVRDLVDDGGY